MAGTALLQLYPTSFLLFSVTYGMQKTGTKNKKQEQKHRTVVKIELEIPYGVCVYWGGGLRTCLASYMHTSSYVTTIPPESPAYPFVCQKHDAALGMFFSNNFHAMRFYWPRTSRSDFN